MTAPHPVGPTWGFGRTIPGGGAGAVISPPNLAPADAPAIIRALDIPLPEVFPIPDAKEFNPLGSNPSPGVEANVTIPGATFAIPTATLGVIRSFSIYITNMLATTTVTWSLLVNGSPVAGYTGVSIFPRVAPFVGNTFDTFIRLQGPTTITVIYTNTDGGAYTVGASYSGWLWPMASDGRWKTVGA